MGSGNRCSFADTCHARRRTSFRAAYRQSFSSFSSFYHSISFVSLLFRFVSFRNGEAEMGNEGKRANGWNELVEEGVKGVVSMM